MASIAIVVADTAVVATEFILIDVFACMVVTVIVFEVVLAVVAYVMLVIELAQPFEFLKGMIWKIYLSVGEKYLHRPNL